MPFGGIVAIDEPDGLDLLPLKNKSIASYRELMFTRARYDPASTAQHEILRRVAELVDKGVDPSAKSSSLPGGWR